MADRPVQIGVAGCGASVWMFGPALASQEGVQACAWMDPNEEAARAAADQYGGQAFTEYVDLLNHPGLDAVLIASPTWMHMPQTVAAAQAGKHVLCEKPMAPTLSEARTMIQACQESGVLLMLGFMKRFTPAFQAVRDMIASGELGEVFEIRCDWSWPQYFQEPWRDSLRGLGGLFQDHGSHTLDLCRWWVGDIATVSAEVRCLLAGREVEDYAHVTCRHADGTVSVHRHTRMTHKTLCERYQIEGSKATLQMECFGQWSPMQAYTFCLKKYTGTGVYGTCTDIPLAPHSGLDRQMREDYAYSRELRYFLDHLRSGEPLDQATPTDGLKTVEAITAAYLSSACQRTVKLPLQEEPDLQALFGQLGTGRPRIPACP